jgi:hypothetical protein
LSKVNSLSSTSLPSFDDWLIQSDRASKAQSPRALSHEDWRAVVETESLRPSKKIKAKSLSSNQRTDWLQLVDKHAASLPKASAWCDYRFFYYARFPRLRPAPTRQFKLGDYTFGGDHYFQQEIKDCQCRLESHPEAGMVLQRLSPSLKRQLAALVCDIENELDHYNEAYKTQFEALELAAREAERLQPKLNKLTQSLWDELAKYRDEVAKMPEHIGREFRIWVESCMRGMAQLRHERPPGHFRESKKYHEAENPTDHHTAELYWFFKSPLGCGLAANEAQVRAGLIRKHFLSKWGAAACIDIVLKQEKGRPKGCAVVRMALRKLRV